MNFIKIKKYSILFTILKYSFVFVFFSILSCSVLFTNDFVKITNASGEKISAESITSSSANLVGSGLKNGDYELYLKVEQGSNSSTIMFSSSTIYQGSFNQDLYELSPGLLYNAYIYYDNPDGTPVAYTNFTTLTSNTASNQNTNNTSGDIKFNGLVPVCNTIIGSNGVFTDPCNFNVLLAGVNKVINFLLITLATPLFALIIIYVAWLYLSDMGSAENVTKAKKILKNAVIGYIIALAAWLVVKTILSSVGFNPKDAFLDI